VLGGRVHLDGSALDGETLMSPRGRGSSESIQTDLGLAPGTSQSTSGATHGSPPRASTKPTAQTVFDGAALGLRSTKLLLERVARALGRAGYASAIWPVDATLGVLPPAYVHVPAVLTASHTDWFAVTTHLHVTAPRLTRRSWSSEVRPSRRRCVVTVRTGASQSEPDCRDGRHGSRDSSSALI